MPQHALGALGFRELRSLMPRLERGELAVAGHAVALSQWHQVGAGGLRGLSAAAAPAAAFIGLEALLLLASEG